MIRIPLLLFSLIGSFSKLTCKLISYFTIPTSLQAKTMPLNNHIKASTQVISE